MFTTTIPTPTTMRSALSHRMQRVVVLGAVVVTCTLTPVVVGTSSSDQGGRTTAEAAMRCWGGRC